MLPQVCKPPSASEPRMAYSSPIDDIWLPPPKSTTVSQSPKNRETQYPSVEKPLVLPQPVVRPDISLRNLPEEIQQNILDYVVGSLGSISSSAPSGQSQATRNWSNVMRHSRGKLVSRLALVSYVWRRLIQERLFRHLKIQGTNGGIDQCVQFFGLHRHLATYVRHIELWVPVWQRREVLPPELLFGGHDVFARCNVSVHDRASDLSSLRNSFSGAVVPTESHDTAYRLSVQNATLDELFEAVSQLFKEACILTIELGHCKKPRMIEKFRSCAHRGWLPRLPQIQSFVLKGAWRIMRGEMDFKLMANALPNLREWHCSWAEPKAKAYTHVSSILRDHFPSSITHLNLSLESFYSRETSSAPKMDLVQHHLCRHLGSVFPQLEALSLTGRVCSHLLNSAIAAARQDKEGRCRLRSLELVVKNRCPDWTSSFNDGNGARNWGFVSAVAAIVRSTTRALTYYPNLDYIYIRYTDLDSKTRQWDPYFRLHHNECTGLWDEDIVAALTQARPNASFAEAKPLVREGRFKHDQDILKPRRAIKLEEYKLIAEDEVV